jgi:ADP-heptose:LPS heptosyltransferase
MSNFHEDSTRSLKLIDFVKALPLEGFEYICLQKELKDCDKEFFQAYKNIRFFGDTAALIECLDIVISSCTSIPHLSAALGKDTRVLLSYVADWRWLIDKEDSPWYPSMKLYRQSIRGDWDSPLLEIKKYLSSLRH